MTATWTLPLKGDISDFLDAHPDITHEDLVRIERDAPLWTPGVGIGAITAPEAVYAVPDCPGDVFPDPVFRWLNACAKSVGVPLEMVAFPFMAMVGAMVGNRASIELKKGFWQFASLWIAIVTDPGRGKSPSLAHARRPINRMQERALKDYKAALVDWEDAEQRWKVTEPDARGPKPLRPRLRHYLTTNATLEAIVAALESSPGLTLFFDELGKFIASMNQYRSGKGGDRQEFLSAWSNSSVKADRQSGEPKIIAYPCLAIVGGITSDYVVDLHSKDGSRDGTLERFLILRPQFDPPMWTDDEIDPVLFGPVMEILERLDRLSPRDGEEGGLTVLLSPEAKQQYVAWFNENAGLQRESTGITAGFYSKLTMQVPRMALVLSLLRNPENPGVLISGQVMANAIELGEFCRAHFHATLPLLKESSTPRVGGLESRILNILRNPQHQESDGHVSRRTLLQRLGNVKADDLTDALNTLRANGRIDRREVETSTKPREEWRAITGDVVDFPAPRTSRLKPTGTDERDYTDEL